MNRVCLLGIVILTFSFLKIACQEQIDTLPLYEYQFSQEIKEGLSKGELPESRAAVAYTYIGEYAESQYLSYDGPLDWGLDSLTEDGEIYFRGFKRLEAISAIVEESEKHQIIIINEAHHRPQHRLFTRSLLEGLYEKGYRYFGLEVLPNIDDSIQLKYSGSLLRERGYPFSTPISGTYTKEPQMANLIREAIKIGFTIFRYESFGDSREEDQAKNIAKIIEEDSAAKLLIHCGWYHLLEKEHKGKRWMASYLKEYTGIDPLTIYQDILIERYSQKESSIYRTMNYDEVTIFKNDIGKFYNGFEKNSYFDILVYHPRTRFITNRPNWLYSYQGNIAYPIEGIKISYPCMVKAYKEDEDYRAIPIDIIEKDYINDKTVLLLPRGDYRLLIESVDGERETRKIKVE